MFAIVCHIAKIMRCRRSRRCKNYELIMAVLGTVDKIICCTKEEPCKIFITFGIFSLDCHFFMVIMVLLRTSPVFQKIDFFTYFCWYLRIEAEEDMRQYCVSLLFFQNILYLKLMAITTIMANGV